MSLYFLFLQFLNKAVVLFNKYMLIAIVVIFFYIVYIFIIMGGGNDKKGKHVRGAKLIDLTKKSLNFKRIFKKIKQKNNESIYLGDVELHRQDEDKQNIILGRPGSGKTTIYNDIIQTLIDRGERGLIYDEKSAFIQKFYDPSKDLILNIADARSLNWTLSNEINDKVDLVSIAKSLIPDPPAGVETHWNETARAIFIAVMRTGIKSGHAKNQEIFRGLSQKVDDIKVLLEEVGAPEVIHISNSKNASDVMSTLMTYINWLEFIEDGDFKIKDFIDNTDKRFIFIANSKKIKDTQKPLLTLFIDYFSKIFLSLPDSNDRRMYVLLDEFGTLNRLDSIVDMLVTGRSKGLRVFSGMQAVGQIDNLYNENVRNTIINCCSNIILLAQNDPATAKLCSEIVGSPEIWEQSKSNDMSGGESEQSQKQLKALVIPNEFQNLDNLTAYVRILKNWQFTKIKRTNYPDKNEAFILKEKIFQL